MLIQRELQKSIHYNKFDSSVLLSFTKNDSTSNLVDVKKIKSRYIPAIFYWYQDAKYRITIDDSIANLLLAQSIYKYVDSFEIQKYSANSKIVLHIPYLQNSFKYYYQQTITIPLLYVLYSKNQKIEEVKQSTLIHYFIFNSNNQASYGEIKIQADSTSYTNLKSASTKSYLKNYTNYYIASLDKLAKQIVESISSLLAE